MSYRVIQWGSGWLGMQAIHTVLAHPDLELVGLYSASAEKVGKDVGELVGLPKIGILASADVDELLALGADCHIFMLLGAEPGTAQPATERLVKILSSGQNVSQTSLIPMCYPKYAPADMRESLESACARGNSRLYTTGIFPGIVSDMFAVPFLACCERVDLVRITEMINYGEYYSAEFARGMGIGGRMQDTQALAAALASHDAAGHMAPPIRFLGEKVGAEIDEISLKEVAFAPASQRIVVEDLVIEPGAVGAYQLCYEGRANGTPVVEAWFVTRWDDAAAPEWTSPRSGSNGCYRIEVEGSLTLAVDIDLLGRRDSPEQTRGFPTQGAALGANLLGAAAAVNAIPLLCHADPGVYGSNDLPRVGDLRVLRGL